ncbi:MAG: polyprenyl synthetase family protein [Bacteroidales bacterium]|jgi:geranylgeranyl diphosphate synthase type II|nr:polyprenyl synthetase family protein [Bacteroidales bacterium]
MEEIINQHIDSLHWSQEPHHLYEPVGYILSQGGKRIRPQLCLLSAELFGGDLQQAIYPAIAFEMLHNFTLIHDDIMDKADLRRGKETVYKKWNTNIAILSGDTLFAKSYQYLLKYQGDYLRELVSLLTETSVEICEGQQWDLDFEQQSDITIAQYLDMTRLKTAVMLAACLKAGAIVAEASELERQLIYDFGIKTGLAFQIQDDLLDVYADVDKFGKNVGGDIAENKKTYMSLKAIELAQGEYLQQLQLYFSSTHFERQEKFTTVKAIYDKYQIKNYAEDLINKYYNDAFTSLEAIDRPKEAKQPLVDFINQMMKRDH